MSLHRVQLSTKTTRHSTKTLLYSVCIFLRIIINTMADRRKQRPQAATVLRVTDEAVMSALAAQLADKLW